MKKTLIERVELASDAASISFTSIPSGYTDLMVTYSFRSDRAAAIDYDVITVNSTSFTVRSLWGEPSVVGSSTVDASANSSNTSTANTFNSGSLYLPNYTSSSNKSGSVDVASENNSTAAMARISALLFATTD